MDTNNKKEIIDDNKSLHLSKVGEGKQEHLDKTSATKEEKIETAKTSEADASKSLLINNNFKKRRSSSYENDKYGRQMPEFEERVIEISRVTNVVKGGRRFSFSALVVIGDKKGSVGYGQGKAKEVPEAIKKAIRKARKNLIKTPIFKGITIPHRTEAKFVSSKILLKPASKGSGIIASGAVRPVVELAGYHDIVTKSLRSSNKKNVVKATIKALSTLKTREEILSLKSK